MRHESQRHATDHGQVRAARSIRSAGPGRLDHPVPSWRVLPEETRRAVTEMLARSCSNTVGSIAVRSGRRRSRRAILHVRQSSSHQVLHNRESRALQYAVRCSRLVRVVDDDLGRSAAGSVTRAGFVVAEVCLGKVGAVAAREVSRFARNSRDWQQLIETGRVVDSVLVDQETIYLPRHGDDRLLLGLKRTLNEYELDLLRQRSLAARYEKARRGELVVAAPVQADRFGTFAILDTVKVCNPRPEMKGRSEIDRLRPASLREADWNTISRRNMA